MKKKRQGIKYQFACFECRKVFKREVGAVMPTLKCPDCSCPMTFMGKTFRAPRRHEIEQWEKMELLGRSGFTFWSSSGPIPKSLTDTRKFVEEKRKRTKGEILAERIRSKSR